MSKLVVLGCLIMVCNLSQAQVTQDTTKIVIIQQVEKPKKENRVWDFVWGITERVTSTILAFYILR